MIPQKAAERLIGTTVGPEEADEKRRADMRKERLRAKIKQKMRQMALTTMNEIDSRWRKSFDGWKRESRERVGSIATESERDERPGSCRRRVSWKGQKSWL